MTTPRVHTYHCTACSHLLLASTHDLHALPTRRSPGLDNATIVPLPPAPKAPKPEDDDDDDDSAAAAEAAGYTLLLALLRRERNPKVVTREDGFEKRVLWRCGRCKVVVAYMLDESQFQSSAVKEGKRNEGGFFYVLPGALTESKDLGEGQEVVELV